MSEIEHIVTATWRDGRLSHILDCSPKPDGQHPLYDQSAIDRLTAERDEAMAYAEASIKDATRYLWLVNGNGDFLGANSLGTDSGRDDRLLADHLIDAAMKEQEQGK